MVAGKVTTVSVPCLFGGLDKKKNKPGWRLEIRRGKSFVLDVNKRGILDSVHFW